MFTAYHLSVFSSNPATGEWETIIGDVNLRIELKVGLNFPFFIFVNTQKCAYI